MKSYYRVMLGKASVHAAECFSGNFIGADFGIQQDLTGQLPNEWRAFNKKFIPIFLQSSPDKTRVAAGLACGALWTIARGIQKEDVVLCPDGAGYYHVGVVSGDYHYHPGGILPHRRAVTWLPQTIERITMSDALKRSTGSIGTVSNVSVHREEIERFLTNAPAPVLVVTDETVQDPFAFAMERHLEDFLVQNWSNTSLGREYDIFEDENRQPGQQFPTDTGPIDILAISKDKKRLLVVELKRGRASDVVVGQVLRYMGYVKEELAENGQQVKGVIIALDDDPRLSRALAVVPDIEFYRYQVNFKLSRGGRTRDEQSRPD